MRVVIACIFFCIVTAMGWFGFHMYVVSHSHLTIHHKQFRPDPLYDAILSTRVAIREGQYAAADNALQKKFDQSNVIPWSDVPFRGFAEAIVPEGDPDFETYLDGWVKAEPKSAMAYLERANYEFAYGWFLRGTNYMNKVMPENSKKFSELLRRAYGDLLQYTAINGDNPYVYSRLLNITTSIGGPQLQEQVFNRTVTMFPQYVEIYILRLQQLEPKWGGSISQMMKFVSDSSTKDGAFSSYLWINLYDSVANNADVICDGINDERRATCDAEFQVFMNDAVLEAKIKDSLRFYGALKEPASVARFNSYLMSPHANKILELGQEVIPADNYGLNYALGVANEPVEGCLCEGMLKSQKLYKNSEANIRKAHNYFRMAYDEAQKFLFPTVADKNSVLATIDHALAHTSFKLGDRKGARVYIDAAIVLEDKAPSLYLERCYFDYREERYGAMADDCTAVLDLDDTNAYAHYLRGEAYRKSGDPVSAEPDYMFVLNHTDYDFGIIQTYEAMGKYQKALNLFALHPYLFDVENRSGAAAAYNDRCMDYQKLGQYQKALDDCNMSLSLEYMPVAAIKKKQLLQQLGLKN